MNHFEQIRKDLIEKVDPDLFEGKEEYDLYKATLTAIDKLIITTEGTVELPKITR